MYVYRGEFDFSSDLLSCNCCFFHSSNKNRKTFI